MTHDQLRHAVKSGQLQRIVRGVYLEGGNLPTPIERALGIVVAVEGVASGTLAGMLHELDAVCISGNVATIPPRRNTRLANIRRTDLPVENIAKVHGYRCTNGLQTMIDLALILDDLRWEQALESALRKRLFHVGDLASVSKVQGSKRIRRLLALRPLEAAPTESLLETLMVQLIRTEPSLPTPSRQVVVLDKVRAVYCACRFGMAGTENFLGTRRAASQESTNS